MAPTAETTTELLLKKIEKQQEHQRLSQQRRCFFLSAVLILVACQLLVASSNDAFFFLMPGATKPMDHRLQLVSAPFPSAVMTPTMKMGNTTKKTTTTKTTTFPTAAIEEGGGDESDGGGGKDNKPYFVIHIGPPKTGTTAIQRSLKQQAETMLQRDNYVIQPSFLEFPNDASKMGFLPGCLARYDELARRNKNTNTTTKNKKTRIGKKKKKDAAKTVPDCWKYYLKRFNELHKTGHNVVLSEEILSKVTAVIPRQLQQRQDGEEQIYHQPFVDYLVRELETKFRVVVIVAYRRYFEWLPSCRSEQFRTKSKPKLMSWDGQRIPTASSYVKNVLDGQRYRYPFVDEAIQGIAGRVDIRIMNYHDGDLLANFYCNVMPDTPETCRSVLAQTETHINEADAIVSTNNKKKSKKNKQRANTATDLIDYDILAMTAYDRGLVATGRSRHSVASKMKLFQEQELGLSFGDLPLSCPPANLTDALLKESLRLEKEIMPKRLHDVLEIDHRVAFAKALESNKFCSIDVERVLRDERWKPLLAYIKSPRSDRHGATRSIQDGMISRFLDGPSSAFGAVPLLWTM